MKHLKKGRKFGRETKQRKELMRDLARALVLHNRITTTQAKAKSLRPYVEKLITRSKNANLASLRLLISSLGVSVASKLTKEIGPKFVGRSGGYTRIRNLAPRQTDGARMSIIELVQ
jgi:large subunit ribosomal protein L17